MKIQNIIFDLGGVVLDIDYNLTLTKLKQLGIYLPSHIALTGEDEIFNLFDCGLISPKEFRERVYKTFKVSIPDHEFDEAWNNLLLNWDVNRLNLIEQLGRHCRVFLLSNTNSIHYEYYNKRLIELTGKGLKDYFYKAYLSFEVGLRKPQPEIFKLVMDENGLNPAHTLFIDDTQEHVKAAKGLGINAVHLEGGNRKTPLIATLAELLK